MNSINGKDVLPKPALTPTGKAIKAMIINTTPMILARVDEMFPNKHTTTPIINGNSN
jgi:hypothetical protein